MTRKEYYNLLSEYRKVLSKKEIQVDSSGLDKRFLRLKDSLLRQLKREKNKLLKLMPKEGLYGNSNIFLDFNKIVFEKKFRRVLSLISKIEKEEQIFIKDYKNTYYPTRISDYLSFGWQDV